MKASDTPRMKLASSLHSTATAIWERAFQEYCEGNGDQSAHERSIHALEIAFADLLEREFAQSAQHEATISALRSSNGQLEGERANLKAALAEACYRLKNPGVVSCGGINPFLVLENTK
jgi:hypothetical protein